MPEKSLGPWRKTMYFPQFQKSLPVPGMRPFNSPMPEKSSPGSATSLKLNLEFWLNSEYKLNNSTETQCTEPDLNFYGAQESLHFQGINSASLCSLAGRYDNPIPSRFLVSIDGLQIPAFVL